MLTRDLACATVGTNRNVYEGAGKLSRDFSSCTTESVSCPFGCLCPGVRVGAPFGPAALAQINGWVKWRSVLAGGWSPIKTLQYNPKIQNLKTKKTQKPIQKSQKPIQMNRNPNMKKIPRICKFE
jgi:hypothetical protein